MNNIGLALSGGGYRATVFHLGVLKYLAEKGVLSKVSHLSTVSGGSVVPGLILTHSDMQWPDDEQYLKTVLPQIKSKVTKRSVQLTMIALKLMFPWRLFFNGAKSLALSLKLCLGVKGSLQDLPDSPRWIINATSYQTGKRWRIEKKCMGDWVAQYTLNPSLSLGEAISASAGFPGAVGPLQIRTSDYEWYTRPHPENEGFAKAEAKHDVYHLWDGGVYENLGMEGLYKIESGLAKDLDVLLVVDASPNKIIYTSRFITNWARRLIDIPMNQVQALRARNFWSYIKANPEAGAYLKFGRKENEIRKDYGLSEGDVPTDHTFMTDSEVEKLSQYPTDFKVVAEDDFEILLKHGYEVARLSMCKIFSSDSPASFT